MTTHAPTHYTGIDEYITKIIKKLHDSVGMKLNSKTKIKDRSKTQKAMKKRKEKEKIQKVRLICWLEKQCWKSN